MITQYFELKTASSHNLSDYSNGNIPFVSNSELNNGVVKHVSSINDKEIIKAPCIAVNGFGLATVQLENFIGAGNGGVHIVALLPKKSMSLIELYYFAAQINLQKWRFSYGRRAIKHRLSLLNILPYQINPAKEKEFYQITKAKLYKDVDALLE